MRFHLVSAHLAQLYNSYTNHKRELCRGPDIADKSGYIVKNGYSRTHATTVFLCLRVYVISETQRRLVMAIIIPFGLAALGSEIVSQICSPRS